MAKALIERMIFFRERLLQTEELHRMQHIAIRMLKKLGGSPLTPREIVRKTNRLVISDCREALQLLQNVGVVSEVGCERWSLTMSPSEGAAKVRSSFVDV